MPVSEGLAIMAAGDVASRRVDRDTNCAAQDDEDMVRVAREHTRDPSAALEQAVNTAAKLVSENWGLIVRVAERLQRDGSIAGDELTHMLPAAKVRQRHDGQASEPGTMSVLGNGGRIIGEIAKRDRGGFDAFRFVRGDLKRVRGSHVN
jgi:hypothetical protein